MARCQACGGLGKLAVLRLVPRYVEKELPCSACGGSGIENCCEGLREAAGAEQPPAAPHTDEAATPSPPPCRTSST